METAVTKPPKPLLLKPKEVDALYETLAVLSSSLRSLDVPFFLIAGSLLGSIRSNSILFNDDDVDIAVFETDIDKVRTLLPPLLRSAGSYVCNSTVFCDRVRPKKNSAVWIDVFFLRRYDDLSALLRCVSWKDNGQPQPAEYMAGIVSQLPSPFVPVFHYSSRKAIELWPREYFLVEDLNPCGSLTRHSLFGHLTLPICEKPVPYLMRAYGADCFDCYTIASHALYSKEMKGRLEDLKGVLEGGDEVGRKFKLESWHYLPIQHTSKALRIESTWSEGHLRSLLDTEAPSASLLACHAASASASSPAAALLSVQPFLSLLPPPPPTPPTNPNWFGATVRSVTGIGDAGKTLSFTQELRSAMEPHLMKARNVRAKELAAFAAKNGGGMSWCPGADRLLEGRCKVLDDSACSGVHSFSFEVEAPATTDAKNECEDPGGIKVPHCSACLALHPGLVPAFPPHVSRTFAATLQRTLAALLLPPSHMDSYTCFSCALEALHKHHPTKAAALAGLLDKSRREDFHEAYEAFVLNVICPLAARGGLRTDDEVAEESVYFQSFPVVRVVRPGDFSIGVHCDAAYGFHPHNLNLWVPIAGCFGAATLYVERRPGFEDWTPVEGRHGIANMFDGARGLHFTTENTTEWTRVSLDFRVIPGSKMGEVIEGGGRFIAPGYYNKAVFKGGHGFVREGERGEPDSRMGMPFVL